MGADDYDVAGAAVGVVEADRLLGAERVPHGDVVIAIDSSGLHSNGFSLVRHILHQRGIGVHRCLRRASATCGEALLEPTRLYTGPLVRLLDDPTADAVHSLSARHRRRHRGEPRPRAAASARGSSSTARRWSPAAGVPRAQRPRRHHPRVDRGHLEPRHRLLRRRPADAAAAVIAELAAAAAGLGRPASSPSAPATSTASSRAPRASTAARCGSSAATRADGVSVTTAVSIGLVSTTPPEVVRGPRAARRAARVHDALDQRHPRRRLARRASRRGRGDVYARPRLRSDPARPAAGRLARPRWAARPAGSRSESARAGWPSARSRSCDAVSRPCVTSPTRRSSSVHSARACAGSRPRTPTVCCSTG